MLKPVSDYLRQPEHKTHSKFGTKIHLPEYWFDLDVLNLYELRRRLETNMEKYAQICKERGVPDFIEYYKEIASTPANIPLRQPNEFEEIWLSLFLENENFERYCERWKLKPLKALQLRMKAQMLLGLTVELTPRQQEAIDLLQEVFNAGRKTQTDFEYTRVYIMSNPSDLHLDQIIQRFNRIKS